MTSLSCNSGSVPAAFLCILEPLNPMYWWVPVLEGREHATVLVLGCGVPGQGGQRAWVSGPVPACRVSVDTSFASLTYMTVGPLQWNGEGQLGSSVSQNEGEMTAEIPLPLGSRCVPWQGTASASRKGHFSLSTRAWPAFHAVSRGATAAQSGCLSQSSRRYL